MPPHPKYSGQADCPPGIKEKSHTRMSGAIDYTWIRSTGHIANGHTSMLPFWVLMAASQPAAVTLASYTRYHKLVRPVKENKEAGTITYSWYYPDTKKCAASHHYPAPYPALILPLCCSGGTQPRRCGWTYARSTSCSSPSAATASSARW